MSIRHLRTLVAIADHKTFSAAAAAVNVTHAAVSQQMQTLESEFGVVLFDRTKRTPELTPLAHAVVKKARRLVMDYDTLLPSILTDGGLADVLKLGAIGTTLTGLAPQSLAVFKSRFPQARLHIRPALTAVSLAEIERGNLDVALITKPHMMPAGVTFRPLVVEPMHLIASPDEQEADPIYLLNNRPYIRFNRSAVVGTLIDNWLQSKRIRVDEAMELDSADAITSMVNANLGVSIVPRLAARTVDRSTVTCLDLGASAPTRTLGLAYSTNQIKTRAIEELFTAFSDVLETSVVKEGAT